MGRIVMGLYGKTVPEVSLTTVSFSQKIIVNMAVLPLDCGELPV